jgi:arogenate dehydrogenase (NADP+)
VRVAFLGLGLIGGSVARAIRRDVDAAATLVAWTPAGSGPRAALAEGVLDGVATDPADAIEGADLVVLAAPATTCLELVGRLGGPLRSALAPGATVTDVASTKRAIVARADAAGLPFVGGHPMAGREAAGYDTGSATLFVGRPWVLVPGAHARPADVTRVEWLAAACGATPVRMDAPAHDAAVAAISHLPLALSAALVEAVVGEPGAPDRPGWAIAAPLAASGWAGMTRLARGDPSMGAAMLATNADETAAALRALRAAVDAWLGLLEGPAGEDAVRDRLAAARDRLRATDDERGPR